MPARDKSIRILHVDDDPDFADMVATFLEREDERFSVETETNASEGRARLDDGFDCIVSDYEMPGQTGIEFLEAVRSEYPQLPFVLFTGKGSEEVASEAISVGVTDYLQKQVGTEQYQLLAQRIRNAVERRRAQVNYREVFENVPDGIVIHDAADGDFTEMNNRYAEMFGYDADKLLDAGMPEILPDDPPYTAEDALVEVDKALTDGPRTFEWPGVTTDGERFWTEVHLSPVELHGEDRILAVVSEIDEQKRRERELEAQVTAMEAATDGIAILNEDQEYVYTNESHTRMYGFDDPDELLGETWRACYADDEVPQFEDEILPRLFDDGEWHGEMTVTTADEERLHQELTLVRVEDGRIACVVQDRTAQRERERELERYEIFVERTTDGISVVNENGTVEYENPAMGRIHGYESGALEGETAFEYMHPDDREEVAEKFAALVTQDGKETMRVQYRMRHADGSWRWLESEASSQTDTALDGYVITSRDITERKRQEQTLARQNDRLEQFASVVSHDLQNPLTVAAGQLELAREDCDSDHLDTAAIAIERSQTLIDDLLTLAREGEQIDDIDRVDLPAVVRECWTLVETENATLDVDAERTVEANRSRLRQLLENLLGNAVEHGVSDEPSVADAPEDAVDHGSTSPDSQARQDAAGQSASSEPSVADAPEDAVEHGDNDVRVTVGEMDDGFYVADDGPGLPETEGEQAFEVGYTTASGGNGLGLAIVEEIAEAHGWTARATDSEDGGARIEIGGVDFVDD